MPPLLLLDTASLYFRAYFGVPESLTAPDGMPINAVRGMLDFVARLAGEYRPAQLVACWDDDWRPDFRVDLIPSYKAHRVADGDSEEVPDTLAPQVPIIAESLAALGIPVVGSPGFEADDVIGTLTASHDGPIDIVTGDRDLFQLVDDQRSVRVLYTARGVGRLEPVTDDWLVSKYGVHARQYADFATMRGDASDGLPGVRGIGEKTAATLLQQFGTLSAIEAAAADGSATIRPAARKAIVAAADYLQRARQVVAVRTDVPVHLTSPDPDLAAIARLSQQYGLTNGFGRAMAALGIHSTPV